MIRKSFMMFIVLLLSLGSVPGNFIQPASGVNAEGIQQLEVPAGYIPIYSAEDLDTVRTNLSGKFIVMNDIDMTKATVENGNFYNKGLGWIPIGTEPTPFTGIFDGNGHKIIGMKQSIKSDQVIHGGLFGYVKNGKILNLGMENSSIIVENTSLDSTTSKAYAGGIVGYGYNITITDCYNTGSVTAQSLFDGFAGGIAGYVTSTYNAVSTIINSYNNGVIKAKTDAGGIAGEVSRTQFSNVYNHADLNEPGSKYTGGIVGSMHTNSSVVDSYNTGDIEYQSRGGGIVGYASNSSINNTYNEGHLSSKVSSTEGGGIVGYGSVVTIAKSYNKGNISSTAQYSYGGGIASTLQSRSSISDSYNTGDVTVESYASGIAATMHSSVISQVFNTGTISGRFAGGVISYSSSTILDSFNIGTLKGSSDIGGIVAIARTGTSIKNTYNMGKLVSTSSYSSPEIGGIVGENEGTIENSYFNDKASIGVGRGTTEGTYKVSFEQLKDAATYQGFDFASVWILNTESAFRFPALTTVPTAESERSIDVALTSLPKKIQYIEGEQLDVAGAKLEVKTNHGNTKEVEVKKEMVTGYDPTWPGNQSINVTYDGLTATFNVSVKAKHTVTFVDYDGTELKQEEVVDGQSATAPVLPVHEGRSFIGWDKNFSNVRDNLYVTAQYRVHEYTVTYRDEESVLFTQAYKHGDTVKVPEQPTKEGYAFIDWYKEPDFQTLYSFSEPIRSDMAVYAKFAKIPEVAKNIVVKPGLDYLKVNWNSVGGADGYSIWWTTSPSEYFNGNYINDADASQYTIGGLDPEETYYVKVTAYRIVDGRQIDSAESQLVSTRTGLSGVTFPKAAAAGADKMKLTWIKSPEATGYEIFRAETSNGTYSKVTTITETYKEDYLNTGLIPGKTYYYKIRAYREMNGSTYYSPYSSVISARTVLEGTTAKAAVAGFDKVKLTWAKSPEATGYEIYRSESSTGTYSRVTTITNNSTVNFTNSGLVTGKRYYYKIKAYKTIAGKNYYSSYSSVVYATPALAVPTTKATSAGYNKVKVSWTLVSGAQSYDIYRATSPTGTYSNIKTITSGSTSSYINTNLTIGRTYYYKVRANRVVSGKKVYSTFSKIISAKPVLAAPARISLGKVSNTSIKISWYKVSEATGYEIYRSTSKTGTYTKIKTITSASISSYTNTSLARGRTYYFKVRAYKVVNGKKIYSSYTTVAYYKI
jgi:Listeria-Bacteroides repeat domain (List_Bact_rpt)/Bacterial Ig-like domain (group 3)/Fibronectin type III domain/The GLUG motif